MRIADVADCYEKHGEGLLRFAATQVGMSDAEDVVSSAIITVLQSPVEVNDLRPYLYRAVANAAHKHWRSLNRRERRERLVAGMPEASRRGPANTDFEPELIDALGRLSPQQRAVIHLTYWEDLTPAAVAKRLGVRDGTVRRQLARARSALAEVLHEDQE